MQKETNQRVQDSERERKERKRREKRKQDEEERRKLRADRHLQRVQRLRVQHVLQHRYVDLSQRYPILTTEQ